MKSTYIYFREAVIISAGVHLAIMLTLCAKDPVRQAPARKDLTVDYLILKEDLMTRQTVKDMQVKLPEAPKIVLKNVADKPPVPSAAAAKAEANDDSARDIAERQARMKTTKDYIGYYQMIREKIRQSAKRRYRSYYGEGEVRLNFTLLSNGKLASSSVDDPASSADRTMREIALSSLRDASPFSPFPKAVSMPRMDFDVTIVFKKDITSR